MRVRLWSLSAVLVGVLAPAAASFAQSAVDSEVARRIRDAMASGIRTEADTARDANRKPLETLLFFGLEEDMKVLELVPAGGWFTKILGPVLKDDGKLYVALGPLDGLRDLTQQHESLSEVEVLDTASDITFRPAPGAAAPTDKSFGVTNVDLVVTFRNLHNYTPEMRALVNDAVFDALRPGGIYGVLDHTRRHMEPNMRDNRSPRRPGADDQGDPSRRIRVRGLLDDSLQPGRRARARGGRSGRHESNGSFDVPLPQTALEGGRK